MAEKGEIFCIYRARPPTVCRPPCPWEKTEPKIVVMFTYLLTVHSEMRIVASCQNALSFHGQRNRWDPPLPPPSPSQGPQRSPHGKSSGRSEFSTREREGGGEFSPSRSDFNQLPGFSRISDFRSIQRFLDPEIRNLRCFVRPQSASPASLHRQERLNKRLEIPNSSRCFLSRARLLLCQVYCIVV